MEQARLLIAIVLSALIFLLWQLFFVDQDAIRQSAPKKTEQPPAKEEPAKEAKPYLKEQEATAATDQIPTSETEISAPVRIPRTIAVETPLYQVRLSEKGGGIQQLCSEEIQRKSCQRFTLASAYSTG